MARQSISDSAFLSRKRAAELLKKLRSLRFEAKALKSAVSAAKTDSDRRDGITPDDQLRTGRSHRRR